MCKKLCEAWGCPTSTFLTCFPQRKNQDTARFLSVGSIQSSPKGGLQLSRLLYPSQQVLGIRAGLEDGAVGFWSIIWLTVCQH